jgi:hypothetical protein
MGLKAELDKRKEGTKIEFGKDNSINNPISKEVKFEPQYIVSIFIPEVDKKGRCGECSLLVHKYEDYIVCVADLAMDLSNEDACYADFCPGPKCPRYIESQAIIQILKDKSNESRGK